MKNSILLILLIHFLVGFSQNSHAQLQKDSIYNDDGKLEYSKASFPDGRILLEEAYTYWESGKTMQSVIGYNNMIQVQLNDQFGNPIEYKLLDKHNHEYICDFSKYHYHDRSESHIKFKYDSKKSLNEVTRVYKNEPRINDHTETYDENFKIIYSIGARPLSGSNTTEQVRLNYIYSAENHELNSIELCKPNGSIIRTASVEIGPAGKVFITEKKPNGKHVRQTSNTNDFYIKEYYRAIRSNIEMDSIYKLKFMNTDQINSQIIPPADTIFNKKRLPTKITHYSPFGEKISLETRTYYTNDTVNEVHVKFEDSFTEYYKNDLHGEFIETASWYDNNERSYQTLNDKVYFEHEYDSLGRKIVTHQYDSKKTLQEVIIQEFNDQNEVYRVELLNSNYELTSYTTYSEDPKSRFKTLKTFKEGRLVYSQKELKLTWNSRSQKSTIHYVYNKHGEPYKMIFILTFEGQFNVKTTDVIYKTNNSGKVFSFSVYDGPYLTSYIHKEKEVKSHPLTKEFQSVMQINRENKIPE